jgi:hypothetical protein
MKVFMKSGAWSHFCSLWFVDVIFQGVNRGFEKCIMIYHDSRALRAPRSVIFRKRNPPHFFFWNVPARQPFCALPLFCITHASRHSDEFFARDVSSKGFVVKLCYVQSPVLQLTLIQSGEARGGAVGWDTALQAGRSRVRFPMVSLELFIDIILPAALSLCGCLSL